MNVTTVNFYKLVFKFIISLIVLIVSLLAIFGFINVSDDQQKIAAGFVGTIIGYWVK